MAYKGLLRASGYALSLREGNAAEETVVAANNGQSVADRLAHGRACDRVGRVKFLGGEWLES